MRGMNSDVETTAPPSSDVTFSFGGYVVEAGKLPPCAGFLIRAAARLVDLGVHWLIYVVSSFILGIMLLIVTGGEQVAFQELIARFNQFSILAILFALAGHAMYHVVCEGFHGSTFGKLIFGLVVLDDHGRPCRFRSALVRSIGLLVDSLFFGIIGFFAMRASLRKQRVGDIWAHTIVAKRRATPRDALSGFGKFIGVTLTSVVVDAMFLCASFAAQLWR